MESDLTERRAALRAMLVDRAASSAPRASSAPVGRTAEPGRFRMVLVTGAVAVVVVAASAVALQLTQPARTSAAGPAVSTSASAAPTGVATPSDVPTTTAPTSTAPTSTAPTSTAPTSTAPTSTAPPQALITPTGWQRITRAQLHEYVVGSSLQDDPANAAIWEAEMWLNVQCMADHGFVFDPVTWAQSRTNALPGLTAQQSADFEVAMYGPQTDQPYDWRTAGCDGAAVHAEGQDHAN